MNQIQRAIRKHRRAQYPLAIGLVTGLCLSNAVWAAPGDGGATEFDIRGNGGASGNGGDAYFGRTGDASSNGVGGNGAVGVFGTAGGVGGAVGSSPGYVGGDGGNGADSSDDNAGGGGGGGGAGFFALAGTWTVTSATGGNGGDGGSSSGAHGGGGGGGGNGFTLSNGTLTNLGSISGGNGGNGGTAVLSVYAGAGGGGGNGVSGANLNIINAGTLSAGLGGSAGSADVENGQDGAAVQFTGGSNTLTLQTGSVINGVVWLMADTSATVTAANSGLNLNDGVLLDSGSALTVDTAQNLSVGAITGSGSLTKTGSGTLTLSGANTYTGTTEIDAGTLALSGSGTLGSGALLLNGSSAALDLSASTVNTNVGSLAGSGNITLGTGTLSIGSDNTSTNFLGDISGSGSLIKQGSGTQVLDGNVVLPGGTEVAAGGLIVGSVAGSSASLTSAVTVDNGALLGGHGLIVGDVLLADGATLSPGNSIGTLTVDGNVTYSAGSVTTLEANPDGTSDKLVATGTVNLGGSTLNVLAGSGTWAYSTDYTIVQAGSLVGTFGTITSDLAFLTPTVSYTATSAELQLSRNDIAFASVARTANQYAVANSLDGNRSGSLNSAVLVLSASQARAAYDSLSGESYASNRLALFDNSRLVREAVSGRLQDSQAHPASGVNVWIKGYGDHSRSDGDSNSTSLENHSYGTFVGADAALNDTWRIGAFTGIGHSDFDSNARDASANSQDTHLGAYLGGQWDALRLRLGVAHTWHDIDSSRKTQIGSQLDSVKGSYDASTTQVFSELGYALTLKGVALEPFVGLSRVRVHTDSVQEHGGDTALQGSAKTSDATYGTAGLRGSSPLGRIANKPVELRASLAWQHTLDAPSDSSRLQLAGYDAFTVTGTAPARNRAALQTGVSVALSRQARLELGYSGLFGNGTNDNGVRLGLAVAF